jgi:hypothetical protein
VAFLPPIQNPPIGRGSISATKGSPLFPARFLSQPRCPVQQFERVRERFRTGLSSIYTSKGIDLPQLARALVKAKRESLDRWVSQSNFNALWQGGT